MSDGLFLVLANNTALLLIFILIYRIFLHKQRSRTILLKELTERESKYRSLMENNLDVIWICDLNLHHTYVSPSIEKLTGKTSAEFMDMTPEENIPQEELAKINKKMAEEFNKENDPDIDKSRTVILETQLYRADGTTVWVSINVSFVRDESGTITGFHGITRDISSRKESELMLIREHERLQNIIRATNVGTWEWNVQTGEQTINERWAEMLGYSVQELEPINIETWINLCDTDDRLASNVILDEVFARKIEYYELEFRMKHKNGNWVWISSKGRVNSWTPDNKPILISGTHTDITERKSKAEEILYLSYHDQLTGLYNRRFYEQELKRLDTERNLPLTIVMGDVNGLKLINDSFGHAKGDVLLKKAAHVMKAGCRADDIIARWGGDEFVIILPKTDALEAEKVINRIKYLLSKQKVESIELSISFGSETKISKSERIIDIIKNTEDHLYRHKLYEGSSVRSATIDIIMNTLYEKNNREMIHSKRVSELCEATANVLKFDKNAASQIRIAGLMHDIGKIGINEMILNSPSTLTNEEWKEIRRHSEIGYRILSSVNEFSEIADHILQHHERWDGKGYPNGIREKAISVEARIIAIADSFDAMTTERTYGKTLSIEEAILEIKNCSGTQFDPEIAKLFIEQVIKAKVPRRTNP